MQIIRVTRSGLDGLQARAALVSGQVYLVTDMNVAATATGASAYTAKLRGGRTLTSGVSAPSTPAIGDVWLDTTSAPLGHGIVKWWSGTGWSTKTQSYWDGLSVVTENIAYTGASTWPLV